MMRSTSAEPTFCSLLYWLSLQQWLFFNKPSYDGRCEVTENCTSKKNWGCFVCSLKIVNTVLWNNRVSLIKLSDILKNGSKNFSRPSSSWVIEQNNTYLACFYQELKNCLTFWNFNTFLSFSVNLLKDAYIVLLKKKKWSFWESTQNLLSLIWDVVSH